MTANDPATSLTLLVQGRRCVRSFWGGQITLMGDGLLRSMTCPWGHFTSGGRLLRDSPPPTTSFHDWIIYDAVVPLDMV